MSEKYFHTFDHICEYDLNFTNIGKNETVNFTISDKSIGLYELNIKLTLARERDFIFNKINNLTIKIYSNLSHINIHHYLKLRIPIMHRQFLEELLKILNIFKLIAKIEEIHFILHVVNGIHIIIHKLCSSIITCIQILVQLIIFTPIEIYLLLYLYK